MKTAQTAVWAVALAGTLVVGMGLVRADAKADADKRAQEIEEKFKAADKDHDGKLTLSEAKAGMPRVAKGFDKIDKDKKGYLTVDQIKAFAANL